MRQLPECTCVHTVLCTFCTLTGLVCCVHLSVGYVNPVLCWNWILCTALYTCTWLYLCGHYYGGPKPVLVGFYTLEVGQLRCFHLSLSPILRPCVCAPHSKGPQVREEDEENGLWLSPPPLCLFRSAPEAGVTWPLTGWVWFHPCMYELYHVLDIFLYFCVQYWDFPFMTICICRFTPFLSFCKDM